MLTWLQQSFQRSKSKTTLPEEKTKDDENFLKTADDMGLTAKIDFFLQCAQMWYAHQKPSLAKLFIN